MDHAAEIHARNADNAARRAHISAAAGLHRTAALAFRFAEIQARAAGDDAQADCYRDAAQIQRAAYSARFDAIRPGPTT